MKQPEALELADALDSADQDLLETELALRAAAELRRLHEANQAMLEALKMAGKNAGNPEAVYKITKAAISKGEAK